MRGAPPCPRPSGPSGTTPVVRLYSAQVVQFCSALDTLRADMTDPAALDALIWQFLDYELPEIQEFREARQQFRDDLPAVLGNLRDTIVTAETSNSSYLEAAKIFLDLCHQSISPAVSNDNVREMLIQHILTKDIFLRVFAEDQFHRENNVARQLDALEGTFFTGNVRRDAVDRLRAYYGAIGRAADDIAEYGEKQQFLKGIYEDFYQAYNPGAADRLGVVYTPNEVVDFIIRGTDWLLRKHFGKTLGDRNVNILDPATGTGTFITNLMNHLPADRLEYKYLNEIHANEVEILPYYIANLNVEYTYKELTGNYLEFPNLCFVDTLDNMDWRGASGAAVQRQTALNLGGVSEENWIRVQEQNEKPISVIIGNPPYNANQQNENDNNKNRTYPAIDRRIRETYIKESTAQKTKQYDMYKRFLRWASDRLEDNGIVGFITNRSYIDKLQDDGFRNIVVDEFTDLYIVDLGGDVRGKSRVGNVFGIMTGVAVGFFVRRSAALGTCTLHYHNLDDGQSGIEKLKNLAALRMDDVPFVLVVPDSKHNWLDQSDPEFEALIPLLDRQAKLSRRPDKRSATFGLYSMGVSTNRDEWVYDFAVTNLRSKALFFTDVYNGFLDNGDKSYDSVIKWSSTLRNRFQRGERVVYNDGNRVQSLYRPFVVKEYFADVALSDRLTKNHYEMFGEDLRQRNRVICFQTTGARRPFAALATQKVPDNHLFFDGTQCLPLYRYTADGERISNITEWGLRQFHDHYGDYSICAEDIFAYTYAMLHDPVYRKRYEVDLRREFPGVHFQEDFQWWAGKGRELLDLHIGFEASEPWPLERQGKADMAPKRVLLRAEKERGIIQLDDQLGFAHF